MANVLLIDDDRDLTELVSAVLTDEGHVVSVLHDIEPDAVRAAVGQLEPDCVLLDGGTGGRQGYDESWSDAAWLQARERDVPVIMFSADLPTVREAEEKETERSREANVAGILCKPFDIDELIEVVARAVRQAVPFADSPAADAARTAALAERLEAAGARDIHTSERREWAMCRAPDDALVQLYWWQREGVYYVLRYPDGVPELVGRFYDQELAIRLALKVQQSG